MGQIYSDINTSSAQHPFFSVKIKYFRGHKPQKMAMVVHRPALTSPTDMNGLSVTDFFTEKLKTSNIVLVPPSFEFSGEQKRLSEEAERKGLDSVDKCVGDIPGLQILCFHGVRVIGGSPSIIREVDQCCFFTYQGRHYVLVMEVKCNEIVKKSNPTRKKAITQLSTFTEMLRNELNVPTEQLQTHSVWPRMEPNDACEICRGTHLSLYEKPKACQQPGTQARINPEPQGFHIFKDKFLGDNFSQWIKSIVMKPSLAVSPSLRLGKVFYLSTRKLFLL